MNMFMVLAQGVDIGEQLGSPYGYGPGNGRLFGDIISLVLSGGLVIAGIVFVGMIVFGGYHLIHGAGNADPKSSAQGKDAVTWAVVGFALVFSAYWILRLLQNILGLPLLIQIN